MPYYYEVSCTRTDSKITHYELCILHSRQDAQYLREELSANYNKVSVKPLTAKQYRTRVSQN